MRDRVGGFPFVLVGHNAQSFDLTWLQRTIRDTQHYMSLLHAEDHPCDPNDLPFPWDACRGLVDTLQVAWELDRIDGRKTQ